MYVDVTSANPSATEVSSLSTPCNVSLCGRVLTISNDGKLVVVSDTVTTPSQVYIYNAGGSSAPVDLIIPGETATAAAFSPDQLELFILTSTGRMYVYSTVNTLTSLPIATSVASVAFSADGSFAYVAGTPTAASISGFATCNPQLPQSDLGFVTTSGTPTQLFPSPDGRSVIAIDPPNIDIFTATDTQNDLMDGQFACNAPTVTFSNTVKSINLGQGNFTPIYSQLVNDGAEMILVAQNIPAVILFNVSDGTTTSVQLIGNSYPLAASASTDGSQVYVAACDQYTDNDPTKACAAGSVHIVNTCAALACNIPPTLGQGDFQQVPFVNVNEANNPNMCNNQATNAPLCLPNLVAIRPQ
jgi:hypothetical protein